MQSAPIMKNTNLTSHSIVGKSLAEFVGDNAECCLGPVSENGVETVREKV